MVAVVKSVRLLNVQNLDISYYNPERQCLEHFRFPEIFIRQTKKAYLSFVSPEMLELVSGIPHGISYNAIRLACWSAGIKMDMRFCRKIFASHMRHEGIQPEVVDLLQGRVAQSVLTRHYLVPKQTFKDVLQALNELKKD